MVTLPRPWRVYKSCVPACWFLTRTGSPFSTTTSLCAGSVSVPAVVSRRCWGQRPRLPGASHTGGVGGPRLLPGDEARVFSSRSPIPKVYVSLCSGGRGLLLVLKGPGWGDGAPTFCQLLSEELPPSFGLCQAMSAPGGHFPFRAASLRTRGRAGGPGPAYGCRSKLGFHVTPRVPRPV